MLGPLHVRLARAAMRWSLADLEQKSGVSKNTLVRFETGGGVHHSTAVKIEETLSKEGVAFIYEDDARGPGIVLSKELARRIASEDRPSAKSKKRSQKTK